MAAVSIVAKGISIASVAAANQNFRNAAISAKSVHSISRNGGGCAGRGGQAGGLSLSRRASFNKDDCNVAGGPDGEQLKIYHDDDDDDDDAQPPAGHGESDFGN